MVDDNSFALGNISVMTHFVKSDFFKTNVEITRDDNTTVMLC